MAKSTKALKPLNEATLPVSKRHLQLVQKKIEGDLTTLRLENRKEFQRIDVRFAQIDTQLASLDTKITKMLVIIEEQNDRNRVAMDGFMTVYEKLIEHEKRFQKIEKHVGLY